MPINEHVQVQPISKVADEGIMATNDKNYDEKGTVITDAGSYFQKGAVVYFDSWQAAKFNQDTAEEFWLVPFSAIRAYEIPEK